MFQSQKSHPVSRGQVSSTIVHLVESAAWNCATLKERDNRKRKRKERILWRSLVARHTTGGDSSGVLPQDILDHFPFLWRRYDFCTRCSGNSPLFCDIMEPCVRAGGVRRRARVPGWCEGPIDGIARGDAIGDAIRAPHARRARRVCRNRAFW